MMVRVYRVRRVREHSASPGAGIWWTFDPLRDVYVVTRETAPELVGTFELIDGYVPALALHFDERREALTYDARYFWRREDEPL